MCHVFSRDYICYLRFLIKGVGHYLPKSSGLSGCTNNISYVSSRAILPIANVMIERFDAWRFSFGQQLVWLLYLSPMRFYFFNTNLCFCHCEFPISLFCSKDYSSDDEIDSICMLKTSLQMRRARYGYLNGCLHYCIFWFCWIKHSISKGFYFRMIVFWFLKLDIILSDFMEIDFSYFIALILWLFDVEGVCHL